MNIRIWMSPPNMGGKELDYVREAFESNWIAPVGRNIDHFEQNLADFLGEDKQVVALNTGTAAVHLALIALNVGPGDFVICQSLTFSATANPVIYQGAIPVFADSERDTWNLSPEFLEEAIKGCLRKGKLPKAILAVDLYGMPAKWDEINAVAESYGIPLIEDAAEALGSVYKGRKCGTFGEYAILSFNGNKIITTSSGGALVCPSKEAAAHIKFLASQAKDSAPHYQHSQIGYSYRMSNVLAGIGRGQMEVLEDRIVSKRNVHDFYRNAFRNTSGITLYEEPDSGFFSNHWLSCFLIDPSETGGIDREMIRLKLLEAGIESRPVWKPMHLQPVFGSYDYYGDQFSELVFECGLCLPSGSDLKPEQLQEIASVIMDTIRP